MEVESRSRQYDFKGVDWSQKRSTYNNYDKQLTCVICTPHAQNRVVAKNQPTEQLLRPSQESIVRWCHARAGARSLAVQEGGSHHPSPWWAHDFAPW